MAGNDRGLVGPFGAESRWVEGGPMILTTPRDRYAPQPA